MTSDPTSLDRLNDLVPPEAVPFWPPAPGWYFVIALVLVLALIAAFRAWKRWQANAYRRAALRELEGANDAAGIAAILRRTALAVAGRHVIAVEQGAGWLDWLSAASPDPMPESVRSQLTTGVYGSRPESQDVAALREYAARWISHHRFPIEG